MTNQEKIEFFDERDIEWQISGDGNMDALCRMSTWCGDDCSEWIDANAVIEDIKKEEAYFSSWKR